MYGIIFAEAVRGDTDRVRDAARQQKPQPGRRHFLEHRAHRKNDRPAHRDVADHRDGLEPLEADGVQHDAEDARPHTAHSSTSPAVPPRQQSVIGV